MTHTLLCHCKIRDKMPTATYQMNFNLSLTPPPKKNVLHKFILLIKRKHISLGANGRPKIKMKKMMLNSRPQSPARKPSRANSVSLGSRRLEIQTKIRQTKITSIVDAGANIPIVPFRRINGISLESTPVTLLMANGAYSRC